MLLLALASSAAAQSVTLAWNPSTDPTVTGYNVWYASLNESVVALSMRNAGNATQATITGLAADTYYCLVTSHNAAGTNSVSSNEVVFTVPNPPAPVMIPGGAVCITAGQTLQVGNDIWSLAPNYDGKFGFYIYRNGSYTGAGVVLFNQNGTVLTVNSAQHWYTWTSAGWRRIAAPPSI